MTDIIKASLPCCLDTVTHPYWAVNLQSESCISSILETAYSKLYSQKRLSSGVSQVCPSPPPPHPPSTPWAGRPCVSQRCRHAPVAAEQAGTIERSSFSPANPCNHLGSVWLSPNRSYLFFITCLWGWLCGLRNMHLSAPVLAVGC